VAIGLSTGKVDLLRLEATKQASRHNILSSGPSVSLPVRNSRSCNALAFCTADPNYLAVGLDKVRGDCSLVIWDIHSAYPALSIPSLGPFQSSTMIDVAPWAPRPHPQIPRADIGPRADTRVLQQHAPTEVVSSLSFLPHSSYLLLAGISHRWLRLFDLRSPVPVITNVASKVQGIATDLFDPHRIGCFGDGVVTIWDARKLPHPLLMFTEKDASADGARMRPGGNAVYSTIEFSTTRRGTLATLEKDAAYVRFWDLTRAHVYVVEGSSDGERLNRGTRMSWANLPWNAGSGGNQTQISPKDVEGHAHVHNVILSNTRKSQSSPNSSLSA
jgi:WD40 repeat protein